MSNLSQFVSVSNAAVVPKVLPTNKVVVALTPDDANAQGVPGPLANVGVDVLKAFMLAEISARVTTLESSGGGAAPALSTATITSGAGRMVGSIAIAKLGIITKISTDKAARLRLYPTASERDNDLSRAATTASPPGDSLLFEAITTVGLLSFNTGPTPYTYNGDVPASNLLYYTLEPTAGTGAVVTLTFYGFA